MIKNIEKCIVVSKFIISLFVNLERAAVRCLPSVVIL